MEFDEIKKELNSLLVGLAECGQIQRIAHKVDPDDLDATTEAIMMDHAGHVFVGERGMEGASWLGYVDVSGSLTSDVITQEIKANPDTAYLLLCYGGKYMDVDDGIISTFVQLERTWTQTQSRIE